MDASEYGLEPDEFINDEQDSGPVVLAPTPQHVMSPRAADLLARSRAMKQAMAAGHAPVVADVPEPRSQPAAEAPEDEMVLVETKLQLASYYRALADSPPFGDAVRTDPYAAQVQTELNGWVRARMLELVGHGRPAVAGLTPVEVQQVKDLVATLGPNRLRALVALADRMLAPSAPAEVPVVQPVAVPPPPQPRPQVVAPSRAPRVRAVAVPGAPATAAVEPPAAAPAARRTRKRADPLAEGRAAIAASQGPVATSQPPAAPAAPEAPSIQPIPMPRGAAMSAAMSQKAMESLSDVQVIETNNDPATRKGLALGNGSVLHSS